jgi:magnesium chelatase family protein
MKILSLIEHQQRLIKAEIEIELLPGIPQIHFLGLPDRSIKESFFRIKSALKSNGFKFPVNQQVIVNISPNHLKKSSKGLELAVAVGLLQLTQQRDFERDYKIDFDRTIVYGELELGGAVKMPIDLKNFLTDQKPTEQHSVLTGLIDQSMGGVSTDLYLLASLNTPEIEVSRGYTDFSKHQFDSEQKKFLKNNFFTTEEAEITFLTAVSGAHVLLSGSAGSGKTTLVKSLSYFLPPQNNGLPKTVLAPHHSITVAGLLGGGASLYAGDIERVRDGLLIMDEFLEFNPQILEVLRAPMMGGVLELSRAGSRREIESRFQIAATTNLCPCGKWTPANFHVSCRFSRMKCERYLDRLSGPILDRFGLFYFYPSKNAKRDVSGLKILERIKKALDNFPILAEQDFKIDDSDKMVFEKKYADIPKRRELWLLQIARIYAHESRREKISLSDLEQSARYTVESFAALDQGR